jgi:hypothetical protein
MLDGGVRPTKDEIENTIGENSFLWSEMCKYLEEETISNPGLIDLVSPAGKFKIMAELRN